MLRHGKGKPVWQGSGIEVRLRKMNEGSEGGEGGEDGQEAVEVVEQG